MMTLFKYMYYRIARVVKQFGTWGEEYYDSYSVGYLAICLTLNSLLIVLATLYWAFNIHPTASFEFFYKYLAIPLALIVVFVLPDDDEGKWYKQQDEKYKNERFQSLKGFCVVLYMVGSVVSFIVFMIASMQHT